MMRISILFFYLLCPALLLAQGIPGAIDTHEIRFRNEYDRTVERLSIGDFTAENIVVGSETEYQPGGSGRLIIKGRLAGQGNIYLDGVITLRSTAYSRWTVTLTGDRQFVVQEEPSEQKYSTNGKEEEKVVQSRYRNRIRFFNDFNRKVIEVKIGPVIFRNILPGKASAYVLIPSGTHVVTGEIDGFGPDSINGTVDIEDVRNKRFTETLDYRGILILYQDSP